MLFERGMIEPCLRRVEFQSNLAALRQISLLTLYRASSSSSSKSCPALPAAAINTVA
jgi:hypothetical protein